MSTIPNNLSRPPRIPLHDPQNPIELPFRLPMAGGFDTRHIGRGVLAIAGVPAAGKVGTAYSFIPTTTGGSGTKTFALTGTLPTGLSFSTSTGAISGTPSVAGSNALSIKVTDDTGNATLSIPALVIAP